MRRKLTYLLSVCLLPALAGAGAVSEDVEPGQPDVERRLGPPPPTPPLPGTLGCAVTYRMSNVTYNWFDMTDAYEWDGLTDDDIDQFNMPFPFIYYGKRWTQLAVCSNGWLSFLEDDDSCPGLCPDCTSVCGHVPIPTADRPNGPIAPFWRDLNPYPVDGRQRLLKLKTFGSEPNRVLVVTYDDFPLYGENPVASSYTFQVAFYETSNVIRFQYRNMVGDTKLMTVGIENLDGTGGVQYSFDRSQNLNGKAVEFRPTLPSFNCANAKTLACNATLTDEPTGAGNVLSKYGCTNGVFFANERVFKLDLTGVNLVNLSVTPKTAGKNLRLFLMSACDLCNCLEGDVSEIRTALGPGRYYVMVDGPLDTDSVPFDIALTCQVLLGPPTGNRVSVGDPAQCGQFKFDVDQFADGRGVWTSDGMIRYTSDRNYFALRVDGDDSRIYGTNSERSYCRLFDDQAAWGDDATDTAVAYFRAGEVDVVQKLFGAQVSAGGVCCGLRVETTFTNRDVFPHYFEWRTLHSLDFGPGVAGCAGESRVEGSRLRVDPNPLDYLDEQNLSCDSVSNPPGRCGVRCSTPAEVINVDDDRTVLVSQLFGDATLDAVRGEWVQYFDANAVCRHPVRNPNPDPWLGSYLPIPDLLNNCRDISSLLYAWRIPKGTQPVCTSPNDAWCLRPGASKTVVNFIGRGCRLNRSCSSCLASTNLVVPATRICIGTPVTLDGTNSSFIGCDPPANQEFRWFRDTAPVGSGQKTLLVNEPAPGDYFYELATNCNPPPGGIPCAEIRSSTLSYYDCNICSPRADVVASKTDPCVWERITLTGTNSSLTNCPGTPTFAWKVDGVVIEGQDGPVLETTQSVAGTYVYELTVSCEPPPVGLNCSDSKSIPIVYSAGTGVPSDRGNTLHLTRPAVTDVVLAWEDANEPETLYYEVLRWDDPVPIELTIPPAQPLETDIFTPSTVDPSVGDDSGNYYYRVRGVGCAGAVGPY